MTWTTAETIVFFSASGGTGKSRFAVQTALRAARQGRSTVLIDADPLHPSAHMYLGVPQAAVSALNDAAGNAGAGHVHLGAEALEPLRITGEPPPESLSLMSGTHRDSPSGLLGLPEPTPRAPSTPMSHQRRLIVVDAGTVGVAEGTHRSAVARLLSNGALGVIPMGPDRYRIDATRSLIGALTAEDIDPAAILSFTNFMHPPKRSQPDPPRGIPDVGTFLGHCIDESRRGLRRKTRAHWSVASMVDRILGLAPAT